MLCVFYEMTGCNPLSVLLPGNKVRDSIAQCSKTLLITFIAQPHLRYRNPRSYSWRHEIKACRGPHVRSKIQKERYFARTCHHSSRYANSAVRRAYYKTKEELEVQTRNVWLCRAAMVLRQHGATIQDQNRATIQDSILCIVCS